MSAVSSRRIIIAGAAGRDFHNFNVAYRDDPDVEVVAFTAAQIPGIAGRCYPQSLAGKRYPEGIPILDEAQLGVLVVELNASEIVFAYSDVSHDFVMQTASVSLAAGADFSLLGPNRTMLQSKIPCIAICAARTGVGKSQTTRWLAGRLTESGYRVAVIRHPMPYGDLERQATQRFQSLADLDAAECTIEEREEYEPHIAAGFVVFAGVDYAAILDAAEAEADILLWDGGNNDFSFIRPDISIALTDPLRPDDASRHHPGDAVMRMADIVVVAKANSATAGQIAAAEKDARALAPRAAIVRVGSKVSLDDPEAVRGKRVLVVEDGPTTTHGGMPSGAGLIAAAAAGVEEIIDPRPFAIRSLADVYEKYAHLGPVLPALGYSDAQRRDLSATLDASDADVVIAGTPIDLSHAAKTRKPVVRARYELDDFDDDALANAIISALAERGIAPRGVDTLTAPLGRTPG